jgi:hypothetical protein
MAAKLKIEKRGDEILIKKNFTEKFGIYVKLLLAM